MTFETSPHPLARYGRFFAAVMGSATATVATLYLMVQLVQNDDLPQVIEEPYDHSRLCAHPRRRDDYREAPQGGRATSGRKRATPAAHGRQHRHESSCWR